jgi:FtsP/CotA-like multicopper oxidase with cupredoxin domain
MLAYNGSVPGPTLHVEQGSQITVHTPQRRRRGDDRALAGPAAGEPLRRVPHETQLPIPIGGSYGCQVQFPDAGFYWYHPHIREDLAQEMGLYGTIIVEPTDAAYWPAVDREFLTLDTCSSRTDRSRRSTGPGRTSRRWAVSATSC